MSSTFAAGSGKGFEGDDVPLVVLLDSGSTHNFVDTEAATRAGIKLLGRVGLRVAVANRDRLTSSGSCNNLQISVGDEFFSIACYGLALGFFDMVLGVQWLKSLGPILWDFGRRAMTFVQDGHRVMWCAADTGDPQPCLQRRQPT
jgi:hypothetical protein